MTSTLGKVAAAMLILGAYHGTVVRAQDPEPPTDGPVARLGSANARDMFGAEQAIRSQRDKTVRSLLKLARSRMGQPGLRGWMHPTIELLGEYRAVEAAEFLVTHVEYSTGVIDESHPLASFTAAIALVEIGVPAIRKISVRMNRDVTDRELRLFAFVIHYIDGKEVGVYRLQRLLAEARGEARRANLARLIEMCQKVDGKRSATWPWRQPDDSPRAP